MKNCLNCNTEMEDPKSYTGNYNCTKCYRIFTLQMSVKNCDRLYLAIALMISTIFVFRELLGSIPWVISIVVFGSLIGTLSVMHTKAELFPYPAKEISTAKSLLVSLGYAFLILSLFGITLLTSAPWPLVASIATVVTVISLITYKELKYRK